MEMRVVVVAAAKNFRANSPVAKLSYTNWFEVVQKSRKLSSI